jgi:NAD(P)-dependent dehydrogenase (short-subunit alcohol dehydrogenase family)
LSVSLSESPEVSSRVSDSSKQSAKTASELPDDFSAVPSLLVGGRGSVGIRSLVPSMIASGYGRIVNVSSGWGSFAEGMGGPGAYGVTKAALNALTVRLAKELPSTVKVNAMCPGWVRTRMGGPSATRSPEEGADTAVWLSTLPEDGPTGGFFRDREPIEW